VWVRNFQIRAGFPENGSVEKPHDSVKVLGKALQKKENFPTASVVRLAIKAIRGFVRYTRIVLIFSRPDSGLFHYSLAFRSSKIRRCDHRSVIALSSGRPN
jgi:hypothetical protein